MHEEDIEDKNIPRMLWFALEPMVPEYPEKALALATSGQIPQLLTHTTRRLVSGSVAPTGPKRGGVRNPTLAQRCAKDCPGIPTFQRLNQSSPPTPNAGKLSK